jgi:hypothetical protein
LEEGLGAFEVSIAQSYGAYGHASETLRICRIAPDLENRFGWSTSMHGEIRSSRS